MAVEHNQPPEMDLDKTDKLPILEGVLFDADVADDAVRMERTLPGAPFLSGSSPGEFVRPSAIDLPSLAESVRSVEERIARQNAEFEALTRSFERARDAEAAALTRAGAIERELAAARTALEAESIRSRDLESDVGHDGSGARSCAFSGRGGCARIGAAPDARRKRCASPLPPAMRRSFKCCMP